MPYRITPSLGPDLNQKGQPFYWDSNRGATASPTYALGSTVKGSDGHDYTLVQSNATLAAGAACQFTDGTWVATAGGSAYVVPADLTGGVVAGDYFHARKVAL